MVVRVNMWALLDLPYVAHPLIIKKNQQHTESV
jgi:hypothetical protein